MTESVDAVDDDLAPEPGSLIIAPNEKAPTKSRQAGMIGHARGILRYRGPENHPAGTVYRVNVPTFVARLEELLDDARVPGATRDRIVAAAVEKYGTKDPVTEVKTADRHVEAFIPEGMVVPAVWLSAIGLFGAAGDDLVKFRDGLIDREAGQR